MYINLIEILLHNNGTILLVDKKMLLDKRGAVYLQWRIAINSNSFLRQFFGKFDFIRNIYFKFINKFDGYIRIYLTLECNLTCQYCVNQCHSKEKLKDGVFIPAK